MAQQAAASARHAEIASGMMRQAMEIVGMGEDGRTDDVALDADAHRFGYRVVLGPVRT